MAKLSSEQMGVLNSGYWFGQLPKAKAERLIQMGVLRQLSDQHPLFFRGDEPDGVYALLQGVLRVSGVCKDGKEALLTLIEPPTWFGEICLFDQLPRTHDVFAHGEALVLILQMADLKQLLQEDAQWWQHFGVLMAFKTRLFMINLEDMSLLSPEGRLARRLVWMAQSSLQVKADGRIHLAVNQANLAAMLSISRQTVNRALMRLQQDGVVAVAYGRIEVTDVNRLADIAQLTAVERRLLAQLLHLSQPR